MPTQPLVANCKSTDSSDINLQHLRLFHHFRTHTQPTLAFPSGFWEQTIQLCFEYEFLMNSVLCLSARHLATSQRDCPAYAAFASGHLNCALSQFCQELSVNLISINVDAFIATSLLLQYEIWSRTDFHTIQEGGQVSFDPAVDPIFSFNASLKQVFLRGIPQASAQKSTLLKYLQHDPQVLLDKACRINTETHAGYQERFSRGRPLGSEMLDVIGPDPNGNEDATVSSYSRHNFHDVHSEPGQGLDSYIGTIDKLSYVLRFLPMGNQRQKSFERHGLETAILPELARYIFTFPLLCRGHYESLVYRSDPHALLLLYHFYRAVRVLLPREQYWWASNRATALETCLEGWLLQKIS